MFTYLVSVFAENKTGTEIKLQTYNEFNGIIKRRFNKGIAVDTKFRLYNATWKKPHNNGKYILILNNYIYRWSRG